MNYDELVYNRISDGAKLPGARLFWGPRPPEPPYFTYCETPVSMYADNRNHAKLPRYRVTLYQSEMDQGVMSRFESVIAGLGTYIRHADEYEDDLFVTTYDLNVLGGIE